jgi:hypothetical protein
MSSMTVGRFLSSHDIDGEVKFVYRKMNNNSLVSKLTF